MRLLIQKKNNVGYLALQYMTSMISSMLNARLSELVQSANPPFTRASSYYSDFFVAKTKKPSHFLPQVKPTALKQP